MKETNTRQKLVQSLEDSAMVFVIYFFDFDNNRN